jgi:putative glutamine amidotransferase
MYKLTQPPTIGITTFDRNEHGHYHLASTTVEAIRLAGGLPVLLTPGEADESAAILEVVDGLIFSGGGDLDPATYNGSAHPAISDVNQWRDAFELKLARLALKTDIPMLGICRGIGVLSVASGGNLVSHIPDEFSGLVAHTGGTAQSVKHQVQIKQDSRLASIMKASEATVVSLHHQAVSSVPPGWRVVAHTSDQVIEAMEHEHHPWAIALQWHPELALDDLQAQHIFCSLVEASYRRKIKNKHNYSLLTSPSFCN